MVAGKRGQGYGYDFWLLGKRHRKARFKTKAEATSAEKLKRDELLSGKRKVTFAHAYEKYMEARKLEPTTRESYEKFWEDDVRKHLAHLYVEEVRAEAIDAIKKALPKTLGPKSINQRLILVRAVLRFAWGRDWLVYPPRIEFETLHKKHKEAYTPEQHESLREGFFRLQPQWYLFMYITTRLGLRAGEIYALTHDSFRRNTLSLVIDKSAQRGRKTRPLTIKLRKGNDSYTLDVTPDIFDAYEWHCKMGYAGREYVFAPTDVLPKYLDSHKIPLAKVQTAMGLRRVGHHLIGRHSVGTQADAAGASLKAIQAQLGHKSPQSTLNYIQSNKGDQRKIVEKSRPEKAPHELN